SQQVVEVPVLDALEERGDLLGGIDQRRSLRVPGVADGDTRAAGQRRHLDTVAAGVAPAALPPGQTREVAGGHAVTSIGHGLLFHLVSWRIDGRGAAVGGAGHGSPCHRRVTTGSSPRSPSLLVQELTLN